VIEAQRRRRVVKDLSMAGGGSVDVCERREEGRKRWKGKQTGKGGVDAIFIPAVFFSHRRGWRWKSLSRNLERHPACSHLDQLALYLDRLVKTSHTTLMTG
jgi:hypothetical protein